MNLLLNKLKPRGTTMAKYPVQVSIKSNAPIDELFYDMQVYREVAGIRFNLLKPTGKQPVQQGYVTAQHETEELVANQVADGILELILYRKDEEVLDEPFTAIYSITPVMRGKEKKPLLSRPYVKYLETVNQTKKSQGGSTNIVPVAISSQERIFEAPEHPVGDPLDPFTKTKIDNDLIARLQRPYPNQDRSSLCGAASFFYCLLKDRPDLYQQIVKDLWETGETQLGTLNIKPSDKCRHPTSFFYQNGNTRVPAIDWITLASLRDSENILLRYSSPDAAAAGITMWGKIKAWYRKIGAERIFNNISIIHSNRQDAVNLSSYVGNGNYVVTLIGSGMIGGDTRAKSHWVVWESPLRTAGGSLVTSNTPLTEVVRLQVFSWGGIYNLTPGLTLKDFLKYLYGGLVFKKIP